MTKKPPISDRSSSRGRRLSAEEKAVWDGVARSVRRALGRAEPEAPPEAAAAQARLSKSAEKNGEAVKTERRGALKATTADPRTLTPKGGREPLIRHRPAGDPIDPLGPKTPGLDRRTAQRLAKGERRPEARLDLHGMTAERAHGALIAFIQRESVSGARCVLVITGKGGRNDRSGWVDWRAGDKGVLRTMTPEWLRQPPIGGLVVGVFEAHQRHGGAGALYVYLRKRR